MVARTAALALVVLASVALALTPIGLNPIVPYQLSKGKTTTYEFSYIPASQILQNAVLRITFPSEFDYAVIAANLECMARTDSTSWASVPCSFSNQQVILTLGKVKVENNYAVVSSPKNPSTYNMSSYFSLCLGYDDVVTECNQLFGKVIFSAPPITTTGTASSPSITALTSVIVGQGGTYQFGFSFGSSYAIGNSIRVTFPIGFTSKNPICQMTGTYNQVIQTLVLPNSRSVECRLINKTLGSGEILKIVGMTNPLYSGSFGNSVLTSNFQIELLSGNTNIVLEDITCIQSVTISPGAIQASITPENYFVKSTSTYSFYINLLNSLNSTNYIRLRFPSSWTLYNNQCSAVTGFVLGSSPLSCNTTTDVTYSYLKVWNFLSASSTTQILLQVRLSTPNSPTSHNIDISTFNAMGIMDSTTLSITLNNTYGTVNMLSVNAITANIKVPAGKTGPLEMTFFLNYQLPQTNVLTSGTIYVKIYPQIPLPPTGTNGVVKCYFFNTIPASTCTWDVSNGAYTYLTIKTPLNSFYQYSEIPITVTTEGASTTSNIGITLSSLVQRYRFEINFYKMSSTTIPTEVFYTEYIADAIQISTIYSVTAKALTSQVNEWTHIQVVMTSPLSFTDTSKGFRFKIEFLSGGGWANALGYTPETLTKKFPCYMYGTGATDITQISCDLYTFTSGPYASLTAVNPGPYILVYGFPSNLWQGNSYRFEFPRILIGASTNVQTSIRFSILEETPAMLQPYIELYYEPFTLFTTTSQSLSTDTAITMGTLSNASINAMSQYTFTWNTVTAADAIIYEFDKNSVPSFSAGSATCTTINTCTFLGYPANWIIEYPGSSNFGASTFPVAVSSVIPVNLISNGRYAGTFTFYAYAYKSSRLIKKCSFTVTYTSIPMTSYQFYLSGQSTSYIYKGVEQYYNVRFRPKTTTPHNGFIRFIFGAGIQPGALAWCSSSQLSGYTAIGVQCTVQSTTTIKIYNINSLSAGTDYYVEVRLANSLTSSASISPTVTVQTYYSLSVDTSIVDSATITHTNSAMTNQFTIPGSFVIKSPRTVWDTQRVGYVGKFEMSFIPSGASAVTNTATIKLGLYPHPWNSGFWSTPNQVTTDPLVCYLNTNRVACTYTLASSILMVTMTVTGVSITQANENYIVLDTQYLAPFNGILYPTKAGFYRTDLTLINSGGTTLEAGTYHTRVRPSGLKNLYVTSSCNDIGSENIWMIDFTVGSTYPPSSANATVYSRIVVEFPTVDSLGNSVFQSALGGYSNTGDPVGCFFNTTGTSYMNTISSSTPMTCRLIKSEVTGEPARVEILNHNEFNSSTPSMKVYIAKVFNPSVFTASVNISVSITQVTVATNNVDELYYDTFNVFMNTQANSPAADVAQYVSNSQDYFQNSQDVGNTGYINLYVHSTSIASNGYFYVVQLPSNFTVLNHEATTAFAGCDWNWHYECMTFPEINYVVVRSYTNQSYFQPNVVFPTSISQVATTYNNLVWSNYRFLGKVVTTLSWNRWSEIRGAITLDSGTVYVEGSSSKLVRKRREVQINVDFTTVNPIPVGGTIEIKFPTSVPVAYTHCRSAITKGSRLFSMAGSYSGEVGCGVQFTSSSYSWVVTGFSAVSPGTRVIISGKIDLPDQSGDLGTGEIITYSNMHDSNIRSNGAIIDYATNSSFGLSVTNSYAFNVNSEFAMIETLPLRTSYTGPLRFKFKLGSTFTGQDVSRLQVRLPQTSVLGFSGGFSYDTRKKVCQILDTSTNEMIGCMVISQVNDITANFTSILLTISSSSTLTSTTLYQIKITTQSGTPNAEGLAFPTTAGLYKVDINFDADGARGYNIHNHLYLEVHGPTFTALKVTSFVTIPGEWNLIWVELNPTTTIATNHQLVIEIPTKSLEGTLLFANDLGTGISNYGWVPVDMLYGLSNGFMTCKMFQGDQTNGKSARIICGAFASSVSVGTYISFGFKVRNPSIAVSQRSVPIIVYTEDIGQRYKTNYMLVENAILIRNDAYGTTTQSGNVRSTNYYMQTPSTNIELTALNPAAMVAGDAYVLFFNFPLRVNGKFTGACTNIAGSTVYGDAYYHWNNWVIVCMLTAGLPVVSNAAFSNFKISNFYTPWYYLSSTEYQLTAIARYIWGAYSVKIVYNDYYKNQYPKRPAANTPSIVMTPVQSTTKYGGMRDDYTIDITFGSTSDPDVSYAQLIAFIFPTNIDYTLYNTDCVEGAGSIIKVSNCYIDTTNRIIYITPVVSSSYINSNKLQIVTRGLAVGNPVNNISHTNYNQFTVKYYSWMNITQPTVAPLSNNIYCFLILDSNTVTSQAISFSTYISIYTTPPYAFSYVPQQRYYRETPFSTILHRVPFEFEVNTQSLFTSAVSGSNYHTITVQYPSSYSAVTAFNLNDLQVYRPVCYLNNNRIKLCTIDTANRKVTMQFQFALASGFYYVMVSILDPRNADSNGFLYTPSPIQSLTNIKVYMTPSGGATSYIESDTFPALYSLPSGTTEGPFRGIKGGSINYGCAVTSLLNPLHMTLMFNRTDVTGLVFQIMLIDEKKNTLFSSNSLTAFFSLSDGAPYPCSNYGYSAGGNVKCFLINGDNTNRGIPTRIFMTDFTYVQNMNARLLIKNPDTAGVYLSVKVYAYGGTRSASNLYGNVYMGYWNFMHVFKTVASGTTASNTYNSQPSKSMWRDQTTHSVYGTSGWGNMPSGKVSLMEVKAYDSTFTVISDKTVCIPSRMSTFDYDDILWLNTTTYSYAYFIRTWPSSTNINSSPWSVGSVKCKHYRYPFNTYHYFSDTVYEYATMGYTNVPTLYQGVSGTPITLYSDATTRVTGSQSRTIALQVDITSVTTALSNFVVESGDSFVMGFSFSSIWWGSVTACRFVGGLTNSNGQAVACTKVSDSYFYASNFNGFESNPLVSSTTAQRVRVELTASTINNNTITLTVELFANMDAYTQDYDRIFQKSCASYTPNYYDIVQNGNINGQANSGDFILQKLTNSYIQGAFMPGWLLSWGGSSYYYRFQFNYRRFNFGSTCSVSNVILEFSSSSTPGSGVNNTVNPTGTTCNSSAILIYFDNMVFSTIWAGISTFNTNQYMIVYVTIAGSSQDFPIENLDWVPLMGVFAYYSGGWNDVTSDTEVFNIATSPSLATTATIASTANNRGGYAELSFYLGNLITTIGSSTNKILLVDFVSSSGWTSGANDPFNSYSTSAAVFLIECQCYSGIGPLTLSSTTPFASAKCYRRLPQSPQNSFAISVEIDVVATQDVTCYFPEFKITSGRSVRAEFKVIYGQSFPSYNPGSAGYGGYYKTLSSNTLDFSASVPDMSGTYVSGLNGFTESPNLYAAATYVQSTYGTTYVINISYTSAQNRPYVYLNLNNGGPVATTDYCINTNLFLECRAYKTYINVLVFRMKSTSVNVITLTVANATYPASQHYDSAKYNALAYITNSAGQYVYSGTLTHNKGSLLPLAPTMTVYNDLYGSNKVGYKTNLLITFSLSSQTLYNNYNTGSKIVITFTGITTYGTYCLVSVKGDVTAKLVCSASSNTLTITSPSSDYTPIDVLTVTLGITNPGSAASFTLVYYNKYVSSTLYWMAISTSASYSVDATQTATLLTKSLMYMYPVRARISSTANSPLRIRFKLPASSANIDTVNAGLHELRHSKISSSSTFECWFVEYSSMRNMIQETQATYLSSPCTASGTLLTLPTPRITPIVNTNFYELVVMPIGISGCTAGFCATQSGFMQTNFDPVSLVSYTSNSAAASTALTYQSLYLYEGPYMVGLSSVYVLSTEVSVANSLYIAFILNFTDSVSFPSHLIEMTFWDIDFTAFSGYNAGDELPCQLGSMFTQIVGRAAPRCILNYLDSVNNIMKIKIESFGPVTSGIHTVSFDNYVLPSLAGWAEKTRKFDLAISFYYPGNNTRYENSFKEILVMDGTNTTSPTAPTITFNNPATTIYGIPTTATVGMTWPFDTTTGLGAGLKSKMAVQFTAGYAATWSSINALSISNTNASSVTNNFIMLWFNTKLNKAIFSMVPNNNGVASSLILSGITNPYPYQYNSFSNTQTFTLSFFYNYFLNSLTTVSQTAWSTYTRSPSSLININQNLPSNTLDSYVSSSSAINQVAPGGLSVLLLNVDITESAANIALRQLDTLEITFTGGVSYLHSCTVVRNTLASVNTMSTCYTVWSGSNWQVKIYGVTDSAVDVGWTIRVALNLTSSSLAYTFKVYAKSGEIQYQSAFSPTSTASYFSATRTIPTVLGWSGAKYFAGYFENQIRYLQATASQATSRLKLRFSTPRTISTSDVITVSLPSNTATDPFNNKNTNNPMICTLLPVIASSYEQFGVGSYGECYKDTAASPDRYYIKSPYGSYAGEFLLQIQENDVISTSFVMPWNTNRYELTIGHYDSGGSWVYDNVIFNSYPLFRAITLLHTTTTVSDYDTLTIKYTPYGNAAAGGISTSDLALRLSVSGLYHLADAGIASLWTADNYGSFKSGSVYSHNLGNANASANTVVQFAQYTNKFAPLVFSLSLQSAYTDNNAYIWRIPMIQNPSATFAALRYNLTLVNYGNTVSYGSIVSFCEIINEYYTVANTSSVLSATIVSSSSQIQSSSVSLYIDLNMYTLTQWNVATWKLDNSLVGLTNIPDFVSPNDTTNYFYYYFPKVNMVMAEKKTANNIYTIGLGSTESSQDYSTTFNFNFIKVFSTSNAQLLTNPYTLYTKVPSALTLTYFTSYSASTVTLIEGLQNVGSNSMYLLTFTVQKIPLGGEVNVVLNPTYFAFPSGFVGRQCHVQAGFVKSSSYNQVLRCFQSATSPYAYIIRGFSAVTAGTQLSLYVYMKNIAAGTSISFTVNVYGVGGLYSSFVSSASIGSNTFTSTSLSSNVYTFNRYYVTYQSSLYSTYYYEVEGTFTLRSASLSTSSHAINIINPWSSSGGNTRLIYRLNNSATNSWIETSPGATVSSETPYYLPSPSNAAYHINASSEYVFRLTVYYGTNSNGYIPDSVTANSRWWLKANIGGTTQELNYYELIQYARPTQLVAFSNRYTAAGKQTMLLISFSVDADAVAGDEISITFSTHSLLYNMFPVDLQGTDTALGYKYLDCRETGINTYISNSRTVCLLYYGNNLASPPTPSRLSIILQKTINGYPSPDTVSFMIANVQNPTTVNMAAGAQVSLLRTCKNPRNEKCVVTYARGYYYTTAVAETVMSNSPTFTPSNNEVLATNVNHVFTLTLSASVTTSHIIYIVYPENFNNIMSSSCTISGHTCYAFPTRNWITIYPGSTLSGMISLTLQGMNNGYYIQPSSLYIKVTVARGAAADVYYVTQPEHATLQRRPGVTYYGSSISISPTQTPSIFLRNYANTVIMTLNYMYSHSAVQAFYIVPPSDVVSWEGDYCNATLSIPAASRTPYPLRFSCGVFNSTLLQVLVTDDFATFSTAWYDYSIIINAKFTIADYPATPELYISQPITSGTFYAYSSVSAVSSLRNFYISQTSTTIQISQHQVPIISYVTFNTKSFYYRTATISSPEIFYLLLKPTSATIVNKIVFYIPREFDYPGVSTHDNCQMIGRSALMISSCVQTRQNGRTLVTVTPSSYDNSVKIIQLASVNTSNWFTAPALPGSFYNMTVEMYSAGGTLLEKQTVNISSVMGGNLDITQMTLTHTRSASVPGIFDMTFTIGSTQVPPGFNSSTTMSSEIQFIFENVNGFANDLGTGLQTGDELGCLFKSGLTVGTDRLKCFLYVGTSVTDKPKVRIINYAIIQPGTQLKIGVSNIKTLPAGVLNTISVAVVIYYTTISANSYLYLPTPIITQSTSNQAISGFNNFIPSFTGNNVVLLPTNMTIYVQPYHDWMNANTDGYYYLLTFNPKTLVDPYNTVNITCSGECVPNSIEVFYGSGIIRFKPVSNERWYSGYNFYLTGMPTSAYTLQNVSVGVTLSAYYNYNGISQATYNLNRIVEKCTLFNFGVISVSSLNGGEIGVTYVFSFQTNHKVPPKAAVSITIPIEYGDMQANQVTCSISVPAPAYCQINTPSRAQIYLNGTVLSTNTTYTLTLVGLQNPNIDVSALQFYVTSYYNSNIYLGLKICENAINVPTITVKAIRTCGFSVTVDYYNNGYNGTYTFLISCSDVIRMNSKLYISLPSAYAVSNPPGNISCWSYETTTLVRPTCTLGYINSTYMLSTDLLSSSSQLSLTLVTTLLNPSNNTYYISAVFISQGTYYAKTSPDAGYQLIIFNNSFLTGAATNVYLTNMPRGAGIPSTYVFKVSRITGMPNPDSLSIYFPSNFNSELGTSLKVGVVSTPNSHVFSRLNYVNIDQLLANKTNSLGVLLFTIANFTVDSNNRLLTITGLNSLLSMDTTDWIYFFVKGVQNPSQFIQQTFKLIFSEGQTTSRIADWSFKGPLVYYISPPPNFLAITSVSASDYDLLYPAVYTFVVSSSGGINIASSGQELAIIITIPTFYSDTLWANNNMTCTLSGVTSTCTRNNDEIIILRNFTSSYTSLTMVVNTLLNPSSPTFCNTTDVNLLVNTYFRVKIMNVLSNDILFETSATVDASTCMQFSSIRIPIAVQYPLTMFAGLVYNFTFTITKPAINLKVIPYCQSIGVSFLPRQVSFSNYSILQQNSEVFLRSDMAAGIYTVTFTKLESSVQTYFRNILPIQITVAKFDSTSNEVPSVNVTSMVASTIGYPVIVPVVLSEPASIQMVLTITVLEEDPDLVTYSPSFGNFTISPRVIVIPANSLSVNFTITYYNTTVPPPLTLKFALTSLYPVIHKLLTPTMYLLFSRDPKYQTTNPPLRMTIAPNNIRTSYDVGKNVINIFVKNQSLENIRPQILSVNGTGIGSTYANFDIYTNDVSDLHYVVLLYGYPSPISEQSLLNSNYPNAAIVGKVSSVANPTVLVNYKASIQLTGLESSTSYNIFVVGRTLLGYSIIVNNTFMTSQLSLGAVMKLKLTDIVNPLTIVSALQQIFRIKPNRIKVLTSNQDLQKIKSSVDSLRNTLDYLYEVVIVPDATNDNPVPLDIVKTLANNATNLALLKTYVPLWNNGTAIDYYEIRATKPIIHKLPVPTRINFYNATFALSFWSRANAYAVLIEQPTSPNNTLSITTNVSQAVRVGSLSANLQALAPSSKQIRNGVDTTNTQLNKYRSTSSVSDGTGVTTIFFNDLKPGTIYDMYLTASSILPYEPTMLYEDGEVLKLTFQTLFNPNLNQVSSNLKQLKQLNPSLGKAISDHLQKNANKNILNKKN